MRLCRKDRAEMLPEIHKCSESRSVDRTVCNECHHDDGHVAAQSWLAKEFFVEATIGKCVRNVG